MLKHFIRDGDLTDLGVLYVGLAVIAAILLALNVAS